MGQRQGIDLNLELLDLAAKTRNIRDPRDRSQMFFDIPVLDLLEIHDRPLAIQNEPVNLPHRARHGAERGLNARGQGDL